jgi:hypothetical protein
MAKEDKKSFLLRDLPDFEKTPRMRRAKQKLYYVDLRLKINYHIMAESEEDAKTKALDMFDAEHREGKVEGDEPELSINEALDVKGQCDCCGVALTETTKINDYLCEKCVEH